MKNFGLHVYTVLVALGLLYLEVTGAIVTSRDGAAPDYHRLVAAIVGGLVIVLVVWLMFSEPRAWLRRLGLIALAAMAAEAGLGLVARPTSLTGMAHAFLAPLTLAVLVAIAVGTSRSWQHEPTLLQDKGWPSLRGVARNTLVVVVIQVALGAAFRYGSIGVMTHIVGALVVAVFILALVVLLTLLPEHPTLRPAAIMLGVVMFVQIFLGLTVVSMGSAKASKGAAIAFGVAHVATGAAALAATLVVALETWRNVRPASQTTEAVNHQS